MDLCEVASIRTLCLPGIELNVIKDILLSMKSDHILEKLMPGEIIILYTESTSHSYPDIPNENSYVYARNDGEGLVIERAFVPDTQVNRTLNPHSCDVMHELELDKRAKDIGDKLRAVKEDGNSFKVVIETVTE